MEEIFNNVFKKMGYDVDVRIVKSDNADYQCNDVFSLAKKYHKNPIEIGEKFENNIKLVDNFNDYFKDVKFVKPGFININVSDKYIVNKIKSLIKGEKYNINKQNKTIVIDYGGPNVAKPLHVGHLRSAVIGQAINNILKYQGNKTISDVHLGDVGLQMGQVMYAIERDFPNEDNPKIDLNYLNVVYPQMSSLCKEDDDVKRKCALITKKLQDGDKKYNNFRKIINDISVKNIKKLYDYLSVSFDYWYGEYDSLKEYDEMIPYLKEKKVLKKDDGALIIDVKEDTDKKEMPPCIIQKSDGSYLYSTSDLGTIWQRVRDFNPDEIVYVVDGRQSMHFTQIFRAAKKADIFKGVFNHYGFGTVNGKDNKPFKTRNGGTLKLEELINDVKEDFINLREENKQMDKDDLDIIVNAIIKFADLQNDLEKNYVFDIKKFCEVNGKTGPYILYTYLRINKIIGKNNGELSDNIYNESDRNLRLKMLEVTDVLNQCFKERKPHIIANYIYELSVLANNFYQNNKMEGLTGQKKTDYEIVLNLNNKILSDLLHLLGIDIPKAM